MNRMVNKLINKYFKIDKKAKIYAQQILKNQNFIPISETKDNDIFIAGYPKSGNTWVQNLIAGMLLHSTSKLLSYNLVNEIIPDVHAKKYYKRFFDTMIFKTHDLPKKEYKKVIHLVRDGRDVMVSYNKMELNKNKNYPYDLKDMVIKGKGLWPSKWHYHTQKWISNPFNAKIIIVRYEDLLVQPVIELQRLCAFIGISISEEKIISIIDNNTLNNMRFRAEKYGMDNDNKWKNKSVSAFFRKGEVGNYKDELGVDLISFFNKESKKELKYFNYLK